MAIEVGDRVSTVSAIGEVIYGVVAKTTKTGKTCRVVWDGNPAVSFKADKAALTVIVPDPLMAEKVSAMVAASERISIPLATCDGCREQYTLRRLTLREDGVKLCGSCLELFSDVKPGECASCGRTENLNDSKLLPLCGDCDEETHIMAHEFRTEELPFL